MHVIRYPSPNNDLKTFISSFVNANSGLVFTKVGSFSRRKYHRYKRLG
jgi:hypothetical protein